MNLATSHNIKENDSQTLAMCKLGELKLSPQTCACSLFLHKYTLL